MNHAYLIMVLILRHRGIVLFRRTLCAVHLAKEADKEEVVAVAAVWQDLMIAKAKYSISS